MTTSDTGTVISDIGRRYLQLQMTAQVGPIRLRKLLDYFGSVDAVLSTSRAQLERVDGISSQIAGAIFRSRDDQTVDEEVDRASRCGVRIICMTDAEYPKPLRNIPDPPICLYVRGELQPTDSVAVAVVGTRRCSHYGREQAVRFGELLGRAGFTVVSGLARGIDGHAHRGALGAGGRTIAVLGNGMASIYPREHESLAEDVAGAGAVFSEYPLESAPAPENFPRRNRIIVGLALGVIVIEAGKQSGALITARLATEYNREVFALPGRIDQPQFTLGTNGMIRDGTAKLVTGLDDVLDELAEVGDVMRQYADPTSAPSPDSAHAAPITPNVTAEEQAVLRTLTAGAEDADDISYSSKLESASVATALTSLQLKGLVQRLPGNRFAVRRSDPAP